MKKWKLYYLPTRRSRKMRTIDYFFAEDKIRAMQYARRAMQRITGNEGVLINVFPYKEKCVS